MIVLFIGVLMFTLGNALRRLREAIVIYLNKGKGNTALSKKNARTQELLQALGEKLEFGGVTKTQAPTMEMGFLSVELGTDQITPAQLKDFNLFIQRVDEESRRSFLEIVEYHPALMRTVIAACRDVIKENEQFETQTAGRTSTGNI
jgi:hypothetical protein